MEKRDKEMPYEVIIQERNKVDLYGNVVYYIYWFDKYGNDITNEWKFWSKGPKKEYDRVVRIQHEKHREPVNKENSFQ
nr:MAG TPA: periplasmic lypoprotein [Caudoviricetes sp.]